jgi:hypothetical protein
MFAPLRIRPWPLHQTGRIMNTFDKRMHCCIIYSHRKPRLFPSKNIIKFSHVLMNIQGYGGLMYDTCYAKSLQTDYQSVFSEVLNTVNTYHSSRYRTLHRCYNTLSMDEVPAVSESQIRKTLKGYGLSFVDGFTCLVIECPTCQQHVKSKIGRMYINKVTGKVLVLIKVPQFSVLYLIYLLPRRRNYQKPLALQ